MDAPHQTIELHVAFLQLGIRLLEALKLLLQARRRGGFVRQLLVLLENSFQLLTEQLVLGCQSIVIRHRGIAERQRDVSDSHAATTEGPGIAAQPQPRHEPEHCRDLGHRDGEPFRHLLVQHDLELVVGHAVQDHPVSCHAPQNLVDLDQERVVGDLRPDDWRLRLGRSALRAVVLLDGGYLPRNRVAANKNPALALEAIQCLEQQIPLGAADSDATQQRVHEWTISAADDLELANPASDELLSLFDS